jgi:hypothetical protein
MHGPPGFTSRHRTYGVLAVGCGLLLCAVAAGSQRTPDPGLRGPGGPYAPAYPALRILSDPEVSGAPSTALNVRWASDQSFYLLRAAHGVTEVALDGGLKPIRKVIPDVGD